MSDVEMDKLKKRINELAAKNKKEGLNSLEQKEREKLRSQFLEKFRENFSSHVEMLQIYNDNGKEVTPEKVKNIQRKKGLRDD